MIHIVWAMVWVGCPRQRFLAINFGNARERAGTRLIFTGLLS